MKTPILMLTIATVWLMSVTGTAGAASTFYFNANKAYTKASKSPFAGAGNLKVENFEDGLLNIAGVKAKHGKVKGPGGNTDSVDADDGSINGSGSGGHSFSSGSHKSITFKFGMSDKPLPKMAGVVFTDGKLDSKITFKAWDKNGSLIGKIKVKLGDLVKNGTTAEDRFLGLVSDKGISKIQIASNYAGFEVDHLQFGNGSFGLSVVPVPSAGLLGAVGLAAVGISRRRRRDLE